MIVQIARSNEAKALGIAMGAPWHLHKARFADAGVIVRSSNYTLYGDMSGRVMDVLRRFTPDLEIYSIDEAFLGLQGFGERLESHARARAAVLQWTGIPVSVGIGPTKTLAKLANHVAKKDEKHGGVMLLLDAERQDAALARIELTDFWGVTGRLAAGLKAIGITSPLDLSVAIRGSSANALASLPCAWRSNCAVCRASISSVRFRIAKASWRRTPSDGP